VRSAVKAISVTGRGGPYGSETSNLPHFLDNRLTDGGEVVSLTRRSPFTPQEDSWYSFLLEAGVSKQNFICMSWLVRARFMCRISHWHRFNRSKTVTSEISIMIFFVIQIYFVPKRLLWRVKETSEFLRRVIRTFPSVRSRRVSKSRNQREAGGRRLS
jgi:hypothetical protein